MGSQAAFIVRTVDGWQVDYEVFNTAGH